MLGSDRWHTGYTWLTWIVVCSIFASINKKKILPTLLFSSSLKLHVSIAYDIFIIYLEQKFIFGFLTFFRQIGQRPGGMESGVKKAKEISYWDYDCCSTLYRIILGCNSSVSHHVKGNAICRSGQCLLCKTNYLDGQYLNTITSINFWLSFNTRGCAEILVDWYMLAANEHPFYHIYDELEGLLQHVLKCDQSAWDLVFEQCRIPEWCHKRWISQRFGAGLVEAGTDGQRLVIWYSKQALEWASIGCV